MAHPDIQQFETASGNELQVQRRPDGTTQLYVVDINGKRTALDSDAHIAFENYELAQTVASRAALDAADQLRHLSRFGDLEELQGNAGFQPFITEYQRTQAFADQAEGFSGDYLKQVLRNADRTVRLSEHEALAWLKDTSLAQALERGALQADDGLGGNRGLPDLKGQGVGRG